ncbi:YqzE family protein [Halalkalibacter nanhaiisediminis]|uniref:YqzE-like protein n=1 Tax=Halalkalibacter nanhaiisediminis TaxID=688079 RepID=A0A562QGX6_9BACI|nr:YqzE family protein [Halalkalibacter nanhaiisediminis]TWI55989.1 YqzE-like protein [Halalkalibacter nanhaiisediminis]
MSFNDYVKFVTQQVVLKMDEPKKMKQAKKAQRKQERLPFQFQAFGLIPLGLSLFWRKRISRKHNQ